MRIGCLAPRQIEMKVEDAGTRWCFRLAQTAFPDDGAA
jgi:hypothetical protein